MANLKATRERDAGVEGIWQRHLQSSKYTLATNISSRNPTLCDLSTCNMQVITVECNYLERPVEARGSLTHGAHKVLPKWH